MPSPLHLVSLAAGAALLVALLVTAVRRVSLRLALLDLPNARSSHVVATPRLGGLGFIPVLLGGLLLAAWWAPVVTPRQHDAVWLLATAGLGLALVSLLDDLRPQPAWLRLVAHLAVAGALVARAGAPPALDAGALGALALPAWLAGGLAVLWIVGFINAFNFMDGIDGIAGAQALVAGLGWMAYGVITGAALLTLAGALLTGAMAGFLLLNWSPAGIFMGDAGSALLGLLLATVPWLLGDGSLWVPAVILVWPFLLDTTLTLARRAWRGERVWEAHRSHLYQRLVIHGRSHASVATLYAGLSLLGLACGVALLIGAASLAASTLAGVVVAALALPVLVHHAERGAARAARTPSDA